MAFKIIRSDEIEKAFKNNTRQYLAGNLAMPQQLKNIQDNDVEVGLTCYTEYKCEKPHYHTRCTEYQYVLSGESKYLDLETGTEYKVGQGDFFVIRPFTKYYQKSVKGTKILFFKSPGGNDKTEIELEKIYSDWGKEY